MKKAVIIISIILVLGLIGGIMDACEGDTDAVDSSSIESSTTVTSEATSSEVTANLNEGESSEDTSSEQEVSEEPSSSQASSEEIKTESPKEETVEPSGPSDSDVVYTTETGTKYHSSKYCSGLSRAKAIYESTLGAAKNAGLGACSKCH